MFRKGSPKDGAFCVLKLPALPRLVPGQRDKLNQAEIIIKQIFEIFGWDYLINFGFIFMSLQGTKDLFANFLSVIHS
jgi:hypothetical protein